MRTLVALVALGCSAHPHAALTNTAAPPALEVAACTVHFESETEAGRKQSQLSVAADGGIVWDGAVIGRLAADGHIFEGTSLFATFDHGVLRLAREPGALQLAPDGTTSDGRDPIPMITFESDNTIKGTVIPGRNARYEGPPRCRVDAAIAILVHFQHTFRIEIW